MRNVVEDIERLAIPIVETEGCSLVEVRVRGQRNRLVIEVFIDSEKGVTAESCAGISRKIMHDMTGLGLVQGNYTLIVSSPGLDRPLKHREHFVKNIGRTLRVIYREGDMTKTVLGTLSECTDSGIRLDIEKESSYSLPYDDIVQAKVSLPW